MVNENFIPDINKGRLTAMKWWYAAVLMIASCIRYATSEKIDILISFAVCHAAIAAYYFLNKESSEQYVYLAQEKKIIANQVQNLSYERELDAKKPAWVAQFIVLKTKEVIEQENTQNTRLEKLWNEQLDESIELGTNIIDLDVSVSHAPRKKPAFVEFEFD